MHFFAEFRPRTGKEAAFREELLRVAGPTREEEGCLAFHSFESLRAPVVFAIHSEWADEAAFERHARMPHTLRFVEVSKELLTEEIKGLRTREIA
jgi:quinol monooxygenase YgiN